MTFSKEDQVIDWIIKKLKFGDFNRLEQKDYRPDFEFETPKELDNILKLAEEYGLIDRKGKRTIIWLTKDGYGIQKSGGWLKYIENKNVAQNREFERQSKSDQILDLDLKLKKFESRLGKKITIAGFIIALLSFIITLLTIKYFPVESKSISIENKK